MGDTLDFSPELSSSVEEEVSETCDAKDFIQKIFDLKLLLTRDFYGCDAKWSLFVAAATSYRCHSQLKPFPPKYRTYYTQNQNIDALTKTILQMTSFNCYLLKFDNALYHELNPDVVDLVHWVLYGAKDYDLRTLTEEKKKTIIKNHLQTIDPVPNYIFEVIPPKDSKIEEKFLSNKLKYTSSYGFHGSKIDSFYSILKNGLHQHLCKNALYGEGIYLSSELSNSLLYSPHGITWDSSACGAMVSCVALCEYIKDPVYCIADGDKYDGDKKMPEKYILVKNNEIVRVRYLLFYVKSVRDYLSCKNALINWMNKHKYVLAIGFYILFLISLGFSNYERSSYMRYLFGKKSYDFVNTIKNYLFKYLN